MFKTILFIAALTASFCAHAGHVFSATSVEGETIDQFVVRMAPQAVAYTMKYNVEVCGMITQKDGQYAIDVATQNVNNGCTIMVPANSTGFTFHTHPSAIAFKFHDKDFAVPGYLGTVRGVRFQNGIGTERFVGRFSDRVSRSLLNTP